MATTSPTSPWTGRELTAILSSTSSDSHMWNLTYMQLLLEEHGYRVTNLGACVPTEVLAERCADDSPTLIVISTVNGHGHLDGAHAVRRLRQIPSLAATPTVIGGKLGIHSVDQDEVRHLRDAGFDAVFGDTAADLDEFSVFLRDLAADVQTTAVAPPVLLDAEATFTPAAALPLPHQPGELA
ncbi:cobalamin B12-binding domain-containing protein [Micromonospora siamensis]|uniref:Methylaspartate mutase sigma subunit n=1 Tax=Micromonospora siamensis TaxID=299152 RepID=A0A1C5J800_9ACTN|nr:cobalamin-dependent protein [Micromonospora siamensis]SCG66700.1 methylaspartate mutase sigma subunit [Micromonospora siamensis]